MSPSPSPGTLRLTETDPAGQVVDRTEQPIDSYVENFLNLGAAMWGSQSVIDVTDTGGTLRDLEAGGKASDPWQFDANSMTDFGIQIGDDGTGETVTDTSLGNQLTTNIAYGSVSVSTPSVAPPDATLDVTRTFTNNTGSDVTIREVGIVADHESAASGDEEFLCLRDTGSPLLTVGDGNNATVEYELQITV
jgi:hypothetical protein